MKVCSNCKTEYLDDTLDFCLEDGTRLSLSSNSFPINAKTAVLNDRSIPISTAFETSKETILQNKATNKLADLKEKAAYQGSKALEITPIVLALAHNYWQWLYLSKTSYSDTLTFLMSAHFIVWLILLVFGTAAGITSLKYSKNKGFAITSLVILAVNLLLSIVPNK